MRSTKRVIAELPRTLIDKLVLDNEVTIDKLGRVRGISQYIIRNSGRRNKR